MSAFFWIAVAAALGALTLGLILKVRLRDQQVWDELVDPNASHPADPESTRNSHVAERHEIDPDEFDQSQNSQDEEMNNSSLSQSHRSVRDADLRRSSRLESPVSLVVLGTNRRGEVFQERTSAVSVNLHGCRYSSRHEYAPEGWVTLQVTGTDGANSRPMRARVRSVFSAQNSRELCQVGVELETPANIWGIPTPPEDWHRLLGANHFATRTAASINRSDDSAPTLSSLLDKQSTPADRKAEVTVFPGPPAAGLSSDQATEKENPPTKSERVVITAEQLLQALQGKLQLAAEKAVQVSLSSHIDDAVKAALGKIEEGWKANVRQTEEFSATRAAETQALWEKELHDYRDRAEEVARRIEALTSLAQQALGDSQKFVERFASETVPQLQTRLNETFSRASSDLEARAAELSARHQTQLNDNAQRAMNDARTQLESSVAQAQSLMASTNTPPVGAIPQEQLESQLALFRTETAGRLEERLTELSEGFGQQLGGVRNRTNELAQQLEGLRLESRQARAQHEQDLTEVRSLVSNTQPGVPREQFDAGLNSSREQLLSHIEWRLGEISGQYELHLSQIQHRASELAQQVEKLSTETKNQLTETRALAERTPRGLAPHDLATIEQAVDHATREFENSAARVSDRQLIRMMEQKQVVTREASLELEARASEVRALLQKASNNTMEEFRRRVESQIDQILAEAHERAASSLASLDAESRAAVDARRRSLEADVARAAEQSTMEFRSGMKAFLYSCLVAAVGAVDEHAQTTLAGLSNDFKNAQQALEASAGAPASPDNPEFPPKAASSSK
jgi:hypothetical protein